MSMTVREKAAYIYAQLPTLPMDFADSSALHKLMTDRMDDNSDRSVSKDEFVENMLIAEHRLGGGERVDRIYAAIQARAAAAAKLPPGSNDAFDAVGGIATGF